MASPNDMTERVVIREKIESRTPSGGVSSSWSALLSVWVRTWGSTASERQAAGADRTKQTRHFVSNLCKSITEKHRVVYAGDEYEIFFVDHKRALGETWFDAKIVSGVLR